MLWRTLNSILVWFLVTGRQSRERFDVVTLEVLEPHNALWWHGLYTIIMLGVVLWLIFLPSTCSLTRIIGLWRAINTVIARNESPRHFFFLIKWSKLTIFSAIRLICNNSFYNSHDFRYLLHISVCSFRPSQWKYIGFIFTVITGSSPQNIFSNVFRTIISCFSKFHATKTWSKWWIVLRKNIATRRSIVYRCKTASAVINCMKEI